MIDIRPFASLGGANHGWLNAKHHFAFASYDDAARMGWGALRVWNDDEIAAGAGFPPHPHRDMEIVTYVREGAISHRDSLGNEGRTAAGDVQVMSAGSGIRHAEFNAESETARIFQIWVLPTQAGGEPNWGTRPFPRDERAGRFVTLASGIASDTDALPIRADARICGATIAAGETADYATDPSRHLYLVPSRGRITVNGVAAEARDGIAVRGETMLHVAASEDAEIILVDAA